MWKLNSQNVHRCQKCNGIVQKEETVEEFLLAFYQTQDAELYMEYSKTSIIRPFQPKPTFCRGGSRTALQLRAASSLNSQSGSSIGAPAPIMSTPLFNSTNAEIKR
jgi:hypothetical protein